MVLLKVERLACETVKTSAALMASRKDTSKVE